MNAGKLIVGVLVLFMIAALIMGQCLCSAPVPEEVPPPESSYKIEDVGPLVEMIREVCK